MCSIVSEMLASVALTVMFGGRAATLNTRERMDTSQSINNSSCMAFTSISCSHSLCLSAESECPGSPKSVLSGSFRKTSDPWKTTKCSILARYYR